MKKITEAIKRDWQLYLIIIFIAIVLSIVIVGCIHNPDFVYWLKD